MDLCVLRSSRPLRFSGSSSRSVLYDLPQGECPDDRGGSVGRAAGSKSSPQSSQVISVFVFGRNGFAHPLRRRRGRATPPQRGQRAASGGG